MKKAPCICVEGAGHGVGTHGLAHTFQSATAIKRSVAGFIDVNGGAAMIAKSDSEPLNAFRHPSTTLGQAQKDGARAVTQTFPESACDEPCIEAQLKAYHESSPPQGAGLNSNQQIKAVHTCNPDDARVAAANTEVSRREALYDAIANARNAAGGHLR